MALATRCPACSTVFRISTAQAAAKGGMVRCGECRNVFNSLDALVRVEDLDIVDDEPAEEHRPASTPIAAPVTDDEPLVEAALAGFPHSEVSGVLASLSAPTEDHSTAGAWWLPDPAGRREPTTATVATSLHDPSPTAALTRATFGRDDAAPASTPAIAIDSAAAEEPDAVAWGAVDSGTNPVFMQPSRPPEPMHRAARWMWATASLLALSLLLAQLAYMERDELAARWSPARPWLVTACALLGCRVDYPAHAEAVTIESATIQTPPANGDLYVLTALLRNRDTTDVRYPYLELVLTDLQDRTVLRRVLRPEDYAPPGPDGRGVASPGFAAQSELPIRLTFELSDLRFTGYRLDRFYP